MSLYELEKDGCTHLTQEALHGEMREHTSEGERERRAGSIYSSLLGHSFLVGRNSVEVERVMCVILIRIHPNEEKAIRKK